MPSPMSATTGGSTVQASVAPRERSPGAVATRMHGSTKYWDVAAKAGGDGRERGGESASLPGLFRVQEARERCTGQGEKPRRTAASPRCQEGEWLRDPDSNQG